MVKIDEKDFMDELAKRGYVKVFSVKYCGISFVGGVHSIYLHPSGVLACFEFETGEFEVGESFGKNPAKSEKEDAMSKEIRRALMYAVVPSYESLDIIKYAASKFDGKRLDEKRVRVDFGYDFYDNQYDGRERANTADDLFHMIGDILTLPLLPHFKGIKYSERVFLTPADCHFFCDDEKADTLLAERRTLIEDQNFAFFNLCTC